MWCLCGVYVVFMLFLVSSSFWCLGRGVLRDWAISSVSLLLCLVLVQIISLLLFLIDQYRSYIGAIEI